MASKKNKIGIKVKKSKSKVSFDEEICTLKDAIEIRTSHISSTSQLKENNEENEKGTRVKCKKIQKIEPKTMDIIEKAKDLIIKNNRKRDNSHTNSNNMDTSKDTDDLLNQTQGKKRRKQNHHIPNELETLPQDEIQEELNPLNPSIKIMDSLRKKKKKRHTELVDSKRLQTELNLQQKALNYLSTWKKSKGQWKFEKLTQVWIQNSLYDDTKIPNKIWTTVVEYFNLAKGKVRSNILNNAIKVYEKESTVESSSNNNNVILNRAKSIVQSLNE